MARVLLVCEYPTLNGGEQSLLAVVPGLQEAGYELSALCPTDGPLAPTLRSLAVDHQPLSFHDPAGRRYPQPAARETLSRAITAIAPELVHANSLAMGRLVGPVCEAAGLPSVAHVRDIVGLSRQAVHDVNRNTRLLAVSHAVREFHVSQGLAHRKLHVLYNGVDLARFRPAARTRRLRRELGLPADAILAGTIGQLVQRKGHDVLVAAAAIAVRRCPCLHFVVIGSRFSEKEEARQFESRLRADLSRPPLAGHGHLLGFRDDVAELLPELDLLVHPARQEPLGRVLLEAMACGVPVVATDVGGTREIFPPEADAAWMVPSGDAEALATAIVGLADDAALRGRLSAAALARVRSVFDASRSAQGLAEHYRAALAEVHA